MWVKPIPAIIVLILSLGVFFAVRDNGGQQGEEPGTQAQVPSRTASGVVMYEKKADSEASLVIRARRVTEEAYKTVFLEGFTLEQTGGAELSGEKARYDTDASLLRMTGPVKVRTADGWRADLDGLTWDRRTGRASTDRPLVATGSQGTIRAARGEFHDDFRRILLSGDVHAEISLAILYH